MITFTVVLVSDLAVFSGSGSSFIESSVFFPDSSASVLPEVRSSCDPEPSSSAQECVASGSKSCATGSVTTPRMSPEDVSLSVSGSEESLAATSTSDSG